jgi:hypothetical protein
MIRNMIYQRNIITMGKDFEEEIGDRFFVLHKMILSGYDQREHFVIKFFTNTGIFRDKFHKQCTLCKMQNSRRHFVNECQFTAPMREKYIPDFESVSGTKVDDLEKLLRDIFYGRMKIDKKSIEYLKSCLSYLYTRQWKK